MDSRLLVEGPAVEEIGALGYWRLIIQRFDQFVSEQWFVFDTDEFHDLKTMSSPEALGDKSGETLLLLSRIAEHAAELMPDELSIQVFQSDIEDAFQRVGVFEEKFIQLLYGRDAHWLRQIRNDLQAGLLHEKAIQLLDLHFTDDIDTFKEILSTHRQYRDHLRSLEYAYSPEKSLIILDELADEIEITGIASGKDWF